MAKTAIDGMSVAAQFILAFFFDPLVMGINRIMRGKVLWGIIWIVTAGLFGIGWIIDLVTIIMHKEITVLA